MSYMTITLDGDPLDEYQIGEPATSGWWSDANRVTVRTERMEATWRLPKGCSKILLERHGERSALILGGFTTVIVKVVGPAKHVRKLREEVL